MDDKAAWLKRVLGVEVPESSSSPASEAALKGWKSAREAVVAQLRSLSGAIRKAADPEANAAIILLQAIIKNLTPAPSTPQQVAELERYLRTDDIIGEAEGPNGYGLRIAIRAPLLPPLAALRAAMPAASR